MDLLSTINFEQLGTAGVFLVFLLYLYNEERKDRKMWQQRAFDATRDTQKEIADALRVLDNAIDFIKGS